MKNNFDSELILGNACREQNGMRVFPDGTVNKDLVGFTFTHRGELLSMCDRPVGEGEEEYFHLDKFNLGCLIDYLKRIYDDMDDKS